MTELTDSVQDTAAVDDTPAAPPEQQVNSQTQQAFEYRLEENDGTGPAGPIAEESPGGEVPGDVDPPDVEGKFLGEWRETFTAKKLTGGAEIPPPDGSANGYDSVEEAAAFASTQVANSGAEGAVIVERKGRFFAFEMEHDAWFGSFDRAGVEGGFDSLDVSQSEVSNIRAFVTTDGHVAPTTLSRSPSHDIPVHIVTRERAGGYWHSTRLPGTDAYTDIVQARQNGEDPGLNRDASVQLFQNMVKASTIERLGANADILDRSQSGLQTALADGEQTPFDGLRQTISADQTLADRQQQLERERLGNMLQIGHLTDSGAALTSFGRDRIVALTERNAEIGRSLDGIEAARRLLRQDNPALAVLKTQGLDLDKTDNQALLEQVVAGYDDARGHIEEAKNRIHNGDMPLDELGPIIDEVKTALNISAERGAAGDGMSQAVEDWLSDEGFKENLITWGGTAVSLGLGIGAMIASGGTAALLGLGGAAVGLGTAGYEFERADDLNTAARAGDGSNGQIITDPEGAKFHYAMSVANLVLAGLDFSLAARAASTLSKVGQLVDDVPGITQDVASRLKPAQMDAVRDAYTLAAAGDDERPPTLFLPRCVTISMRRRRRCWRRLSGPSVGRFRPPTSWHNRYRSTENLSPTRISTRC